LSTGRFRADARIMSASAALSRLLALAFVGLLATATLTYGAERPGTSKAADKQAAPMQQTLSVPDVRGKPYVFAEGMLEERGFAWHVTGSVAGFAANTVTSQSPAPGVRVVDTGAPSVALALRTNSAYAQVGVPEARAPFTGTAIRFPQPATKPAAKKPTSAPKPKATGTRTPAFVVPGAPPEPLTQPSLPDQADQLGAWLAKHPKSTAANRAYLSYQSWLIVTGASNGWSRGAEALKTLIAVQKRAEHAWHVGTKDRLAAEKALLEVQARAR
jgi:hypothetical protein